MTGRALRILQIIDSLDPRHGGAVESLRQITTSLARSGHDVEVACADRPGDAWLGDFPFATHPLGPARGRFAYAAALRPWLAARGAGFDAWVINGLWQYPGLVAARTARRLGIPYFVYPHGMLDAWNRRRQPLKYLKKFAYWLAVERVTLEGAQALLFMSDAEALRARDCFPLARWKALVVGGGVAAPPTIHRDDIEAFRDRHAIAADSRVLLYLGRIHPKKGIDVLLKCAAGPSIDPRFVLVIAGEGEPGYEARLRELAVSLGLAARVRWVGPLYGARKWAAFGCAELFLLPSHQENFGVALVESLATGTPVCTTTAVGIHAAVTQYDAGLICGDDEASLASALARWQAKAPDEVGACRVRALRCFEEQFEVGSASRRLADAIARAVPNGEFQCT